MPIFSDKRNLFLNLEFLSKIIQAHCIKDGVYAYFSKNSLMNSTVE
jgi:hypothetical protein